MKVLFFLCALAGLCLGRESILSFKSEIKVNGDGWLNVTETIRVQAEGDQIKRGIYRDFPQAYKLKWGFKQIRPFEVIAVRRNGRAEEFKIMKMRYGTRVRIGSADYELPHGKVQEFQIEYQTNRQLITNDGGADELYWNVTGNEWGFPIHEIEAKVVLPEGIVVERAFAWTGSYREQGQDSESRMERNVAFSKSLRVMDAGEGMTMIVRWPTGQLAAVAYEERGLFKDNGLLIFGIAAVGAGLITYLVMWFVVGVDPPTGVIIPRWEPPAGFTPGGVRYLRNMVFDDKCFTAGILGLAAEGKLKVTGKEGAYSLKRLNTEVPKERVAAVLMNKLFRSVSKVDLDGSDFEKVSLAHELYAQALAKRVDENYFLANFNSWLPGLALGLAGIGCMLRASFQGLPTLLSMAFLLVVGAMTMSTMSSVLLTVRSRGWKGLKACLPGASIALVFWILAVFLFFYHAGAWAGISSLIVYFSSFLFLHLIKQPTMKGRQILDEIEGFREYLRVAEEDRLHLENPPEKTPELFDRFLPYAMALDVEQEWSEKFDEVLKKAARGSGHGEERSDYLPGYISGSFQTGTSSFSSSSMTGALTSALTEAAVAPAATGSSGGSYGGGGGGFSGGGGYSGGGGGGGGGGGW